MLFEDKLVDKLELYLSYSTGLIGLMVFVLNVLGWYSRLFSFAVKHNSTYKYSVSVNNTDSLRMFTFSSCTFNKIKYHLVLTPFDLRK